MSQRHAVYPGSFDPVTLGHIDILERASGLFDRVTVLVANSGKAGLLPIEKRVELFCQSTAHLKNVKVAPFQGLLVDEVRRQKAVAVIRGIRTAGDYEHEWSLAGVNALLAPDMETIYFLARPATAAISSSLVRDVIKHGDNLARNLEKLVPAPVIAALTK